MVSLIGKVYLNRLLGDLDGLPQSSMNLLQEKSTWH